jgi:hypothetical protein
VGSSAKCARRAIAAVVVLFAFAAVQAMAAPSSARAFVDGIYRHYRAGADQDPGIILDRSSVIRRYFTPGLASQIIADEDRAQRRNEVPTLDGDAFVDAQDWEITDLAVDVVEETPGRASATVTFKNFGDPKRLRLDLVRLRQGWRIDDIVYPGDEGTLRGLYAKSH